MYWPSSSDPFYQANPTQNNDRRLYYGVNATPTLKIDGVLDIWPITIASVTHAILQRSAIPAHIWLDMSATVNGLFVNATAKAVADMNITGNKVMQMEIVDRYTYLPNSPNGNPNFYSAMRQFAPSVNGQPFAATAGDTVTFTCTFRLNPAWDVNNLDIVCFVQDNDTREVLQSHREPTTPQPIQNVDVVLTPINPPIQIPAGGGSFNFNIAMTNNMDSAATFHAWIMQQTPSGTWQGPMLGPVWLRLAAAASITRQRSQNVPASAPPGTYLYRGYVGIYNADARWDSSSFTYIKLTSGDGPWADDWGNTGEGFDQQVSASQPAAPVRFTLISAFPNPFNPSTTLSYVLPEAAKVGLSIYDISGRPLITLVDGWREAGMHEVTFDGSSLASGVYLYRLQAGDFNTSGKMVLMK